MISLKDAVDAIVSEALINTHTGTPAIIVGFDALSQRITAQIALKRIIEGKEITITPLLDIPILQPSAGGFHLTLPIKAGDECFLVFSERAFDLWWDRGGVQPISEYRVHDISDGFAIIGVNSRPNSIPSYNTDGLEIRNNSGNQKVTLHSNGDITVDAPSKVTINSGNDTILNSGNNTRIEAAGLLTLEADNIAMIARSGGTATMTGIFQMNGSFELNGVFMESHRHPENDNGGPTDGPIN